MKKLDQFTEQYPISKTLRFELRPIGRTLEHIDKKGLLKEDEERNESYKKMKKSIDEFHKFFIEKALKQVHLSKLNDYYELYNSRQDEKKDKNFINRFDKVKKELREEVTKGFKSEEVKSIFSKLNKKELIKDLLKDWCGKNGKYFDPKFENFTTYFTGFNQNRQNIYSSEDKSSSISYRLIHENLPRFIDNIKIFDQIKQSKIADDFTIIQNDYSEYLQVNRLEDIFTLSYYNNALTQTDIDIYNNLIGGRTIGNSVKIKGLNEYINLYNQKVGKKERLPKLKQLYKQILSDRVNLSFLPQSFENIQTMLETINKFYLNNLRNNIANGEETATDIIKTIQELVIETPTYDLNGIYLRNDAQLTNISQKIFGNYGFIGTSMNYYYNNKINPNFEENYNKSNSTKREKLEKIKNNFTKADYLSIETIQESIDTYAPILENCDELKYYSTTCIANYFHDHCRATMKEGSDKTFDFDSNITEKYRCIKGILNSDAANENLSKEETNNIKLFLDSLMELLHFVKPLWIKSDAVSFKNENFYSSFDPLFDELNNIVKIYDMVRNFISTKPYSLEKYKLNFENSTLAAGWDINKELDNTTVIMIKDGNYYLGIMNAKNKPKFSTVVAKDDDICYSKMNYKYFKDLTTMVPKCSTQLNEVKNHFEVTDETYKLDNKNFIKPLYITKEIFDLNNVLHNGKKRFQIDYLRDTNDVEGYNNAVRTWITFCIDFLKSYKSTVGYDLSSLDPISSYNRVDLFYTGVNKLLYDITFSNIPQSQIDAWVNEGKLYLFQIYNKDFSEHSKGKPNLHTIYWKALFDKQNLNDVIYKLNGEAEIFYRKSSITPENIITHKANEPINSKNPLTAGKKNLFNYELIKDKRFTEDKFMFHVPITLNFKAGGNGNINTKVLEYIKNNDDINIIGLDRGERHLIYLSLINQQGNLIKGKDGKYIQFSFNEITGEYFDKDGKSVTITTPYHSLLNKKEKERADARVNWEKIESIKELKEGFVSQVVHQIVQLMVEYNAIIVMEDLNFGFKKGRFKVEKQVYQKFEKMLIDKLNYVVFKDKHPNEIGGLYQPLQLSNKFDSFKKLGKQSGFIFYVPAWNTSKIDPTTGFVDFLKPKYENTTQSQEFFSKFDSIKYNKESDYFEFQFDYSNFTSKAEDSRTKWTVCTIGDERYFWNRETRTTEKINITEQLKLLFNASSIDYTKGQELKNIICANSDRKFFVQLMKLLSIVLSMRYSSAADERDFILSPVANEYGEFYFSEKANDSLPQDADANGAYHIAKKGLWVVDQIHNSNNSKDLNLAISNKTWLKFVQTKR